jgi:hypothetical protein
LKVISIAVLGAAPVPPELGLVATTVSASTAPASSTVVEPTSPGLAAPVGIEDGDDVIEELPG